MARSVRRDRREMARSVRRAVPARNTETVRLVVREECRVSAVRVRSSGIVRLAARVRSMGIVRHVGMARSVRRDRRGMARSVRRVVHARSTGIVRLVVRVRSMGIDRRGMARSVRRVVRVRSSGIVRLAARVRSMGIVRHVGMARSVRRDRRGMARSVRRDRRGMARSVRRVARARSTEIAQLVVHGVRQVSVALARVSRRTATGPVHVAMIDAAVTGRRRSRSVRHGR